MKCPECSSRATKCGTAKVWACEACDWFLSLERESYSQYDDRSESFKRESPALREIERTS
jgi:ribosomal protein L37AE/L43A